MTQWRCVITIDIETLPALKISSAGGSSTELVYVDFDETQLKTALNGDFGRILCIGYVDEQPQSRLLYGVIGWDEQEKVFYNDEQKILETFRDRLRGFRPGLD